MGTKYRVPRTKYKVQGAKCEVRSAKEKASCSCLVYRRSFASGSGRKIPHALYDGMVLFRFYFRGHTGEET